MKRPAHVERPIRPGRVVLESLRLDYDPEEAVRERAEVALALGVGGFIVFGGERRQVADLIADLRARVDRPLWFAADLERGAGQQFSGLPTLPPPAGLAAHPDREEAARLAGGITARGARGLGIDLVFAPVVDLDIEPDNPIVGTRSFGHDPVTVARLAGAWIEACQQEGVVACAKHFPGHGRTTADSHLEIPVVHTPRNELEADLLPFRRLAPRVGAMLTAHVAYPSLGVDGPATLSRALLSGLLREQMGFTGLVVTDALNMAGFTQAGAAEVAEVDGTAAADDPDEGEPAGADEPAGAAEPAEADETANHDDPTETEPAGPGANDPAAGAVAALLAGCDLLLYPDDVAATIDALERAASRDPAVAARIEEAVRRSDDVRRRFVGRKPKTAGRFGAGGPREGAPDPDAIEAAALSLRAIQCHGTLPEWLRPGRPIRVIAIWDDREVHGRTPFGQRFVEELREQGWQVALADPEDQPERIPSIVLIGSTPQAWKGTAGLTAAGARRVEHAMANPSGALPVVLGHRRLLERLGGTGVCAWGTEPALELFAARKLVAEAERGDPPSGRAGAR